jgi:hypothetical protein
MPCRFYIADHIFWGLGNSTLRKKRRLPAFAGRNTLWITYIMGVGGMHILNLEASCYEDLQLPGVVDTNGSTVVLAVSGIPVIC